MKPLLSRSLAVLLSFSIVAGALPPAAFAGGDAAGVDPAAALAQMQQWGVYKGDDDVLKTYLGDGKKLTPLGSALYLSLIKTHGTGTVGARGRVEEVTALQPELDRLRQNGPYDEKREQGMERALQSFQKNFGVIDAGSDGSVESEFQRGALREALMTGASVADPPKKGDMIQVPTKDGFEFWDKKGLAFRINKNNATTYSRELQRVQRIYNQSRPTDVAFIPETGRYNTEMFDYSYYLLKNQYDALVENMRRDRTIALAELLGVSGKYREDMWFTDKRIQQDLEAQAKHKTYNHRGQDFNILELVDAKFKQRLYYLEESRKAVDRYKTDMDVLKGELKENPVISDGQVQNLGLDEQYAKRFLTLGVLETQAFYVKNQIERLDPSAPDAEQVMKAIDRSDMSADQKAAYKLRAGEMVNRLQALINTLEKTRKTLHASDYAASLDNATAMLSSSQRVLGQLSTDYAMFVEVPSISFLSHEQAHTSWMNWGSKLITRPIYSAVSSGYRHNMNAIEGDHEAYTGVARQIAAGDIAGARQSIIKMNPDAIKGTFSAALGGDPARVTDAARLAAVLKVSHERIADVFETNKWLDAGGGFITWAVDVALMAPVARMGASGMASRLLRYTGEAGESSGLARFAVVRRPAIWARESLLHTADRLATLEADPIRIQSATSNRIGQYFVASGYRAVTAAGRQASFTGMSAVISGGFTLASHLTDMGVAKALGPGQSATVNDLAQHFLGTSSHTVSVPILGELGLRPGDTMFNEDFRGAADAFWTGAKGGIWWANTPMEVGGIPVFHPAMLGYVNLMPTTAFRGTPFMRYAEAVGAKGVVGASYSSAKMFLAGESAATAEAVAQKGALERLAAKGMLGSGAAFSLSMIDNVAKYSLFSYGVGAAANSIAYHWSDEPDLERRIKGANLADQKALASPAWLMLPAYASHPQRDAALYMRSAEGAEQYRKAGMDHLIANAEENARLRFLETPEIPLSQKIFEFTYKGADTGDYFGVTKEMKREAIKNQMLEGLGGEGATLAEVNPMKFYRVTKMADGADAINLKVNDEVRLVAHQDFVEALIADPVRARKVLDAKLGTEVEGFGLVTPEVKKDVAVGLYSAEMQTGKAMPKELVARVGEILKPYLDANQAVRPAAEKLVQALDGAPEKSAALDAALKEAMTKTSKWKETEVSQRPYTDVIAELRRDADGLKTAGKLDTKEHDVLIGLYDYLDAIEVRFNSFNNVGMTRKLASESMEAMRAQHSSNPAVAKVLNEFSSALDKWGAGRAETEAVDGPRADGSFKRMLSALTKDLEKARGELSPADFAALKGSLDDIAAAPWVLHDSKGSALPSWRPEQFESLMGAMTAIGEQGRAGNSVRLFQMLKTGGGKTMLTFEGLLPLVEADAAKGHKKIQPMFLTVQSNLEAQARMEFIAYKKIGSSLKFDTYEGFKTKIAEGKTQGRTALRDYWILGDEMDGAALQPALTIGQVSGGITRRSPIFNKIDEVDSAMTSRLNGARDARDTRVLTETRRVLDDVGSMDQTGATGKVAKQAKLEAVRLEAAARDLKGANGPEARASAEAEVRARAAKLTELLGGVPSRENAKVGPASEGLKRVVASLDAPAAGVGAPTGLAGLKAKLFAKPGATPESRARDGLVADLQAGFARQENLLGMTGGESGLRRLAVDANARGAELEARIERLKARQQKEGASAEPAAAARVKAIGDEIVLATGELAIVDRFRSAGAGLRLSNLQEKLAAAEGEPSSASAESVAAWRRKAAEYEAALPGEARPTARERAQALSRLYGIGGEIKALDAQIAEATRKAESTDAFTTRRAALEGDYATTTAEVERLKGELSTGSAKGDLGGMMRRLDVLGAEASRLEGEVQTAKARGERAGPTSSRLADVRSERQAVLKEAVEEVRRRLASSGEDVMKTATSGKDGWEGSASRLLEQRRRMMESFAGDENPMYTVFREMKDDMQGFALEEALKSDDPAVWKPAQERMMRLVEGESALRFAVKVPKLLYEVFTGKEVDIPLDQVGLTRLHAARMIKALLADPTMPLHQRDSLFWSLASSMISPGKSGKSSWVRTELLRQLRGFFEDSAGIRVDNRTGKINVVHNGQWFESMDNESRRFWELEYGVDLTLPYTNQSISTIKDVTTDKKARFISFSGTAGEKLREHFKDNGIRIEGQGSTPPAIVDLDVLAGPTNRFSRIGQGLANVDSAVDRVEVRGLSGASDPVRTQIETQLVDLRLKEMKDPPKNARETLAQEVRRELNTGTVLRMTDFTDPSLADARSWLLERRKGQGRVVVRSLDGAPDAVREAVEAKLGRPLREPTVLKLSDFAGPDQALAREWLWNERLMQGDADHVVVRRLTDLPKMSQENADALKARIASGEVTGEARAALEHVLSLDAVSKEGRAALEAHMKSWDKEPLSGLRGAVESQLASNIPKDVRAVLDAHLAAAKLAGKDDAVVRISDVKGADDAMTLAARDWLRELRGNQRESGLMVLSVSDTRVLKMTREYLMRVQGLKADEISMVFSDTEYLRNNVPEAEVAKQMNLDALNNGKARVLILDTRVGGRGLDLNFKGERGNLDPKAFRGYTSFEMLLVDPQKMSSVHMLQAEGRIDVGRVLPGARREFSLVMDVKSIASEPVFREMIASDPFFVQLRADPKFVEYAAKRGAQKLDWPLFHDYLFARATDGTPEGAALAQKYKDVVNKRLETVQGDVEHNQLLGSSVLTDRLKTNGRFPGVEGAR
jgi:hypothetical protein